MAKGNGSTRGVDKTHKEIYSRGKAQKDIDGYIQAYTAKGGEDYRFWSKFDTEENRQKMMSWMDSQTKVNGKNLYRGSYMLSGDIVQNLVYGGWEEGKTIISPKEISGNPAGLLSFTQNKDYVFSYEGYKPSPKSNYDRFENEPIRVMFSVETSGKNFVDITNKSHYKQERESVAKASSSKFIYSGSEYQNGYWLIKLKEK